MPTIASGLVSSVLEIISQSQPEGHEPDTTDDHADLQNHQGDHSGEAWRDIPRTPTKPADFRDLAEVIKENSVEVCASTDETYKR